MDLNYFLFTLWKWVISTGIPLTALLITALLIPRCGRLATRIITRRLDKEEESTKATLALVGALVYVLQIIAFFFVILVALTTLGVPPLGAAVPATVVSAAIGFGAQNVIGDFLAGFFIISERQFGLGDYVSFDGPSNATEGTVVALTLRSTKIRTTSGELVTIPNGSAGVITNYSQSWSRAVVDLDIPLLPGESMKDLTAQVKDAATDAIRDKSITHTIIGELDVLPAMNVTAPSVTGQSWSVAFRVMIRVEPAMQWAVARVIRARLINAFWDRYDTSHSPLPIPDATLLSEHSSITSTVKKDSHNKNDKQLEHAMESLARPDNTIDDDIANSEHNHKNITPTNGHNTDKGDKKNNNVHDKENAHSDKVIYEEKWKNTLTLGGRFRASTTALVIALIFLGGLAAMSANPDNAQAGWLAPERWRPEKEAGTVGTSTSPTTTPETTASTPENANTSTTQPSATTTEPNTARHTETNSESGTSQEPEAVRSTGSTATEPSTQADHTTATANARPSTDSQETHTPTSINSTPVHTATATETTEITPSTTAKQEELETP